MATTLLELDQKLLVEIGDWLQGTVDTAIATSNAVVSNATFPEIRSTADYFNNRWIYFEDYTNAGEERIIKDDDAADTLTVLGGVLNSDSGNYATFRISKYSNFSERARAITMAMEELYPNIYQALDNTQLMTGNILPPFRWFNSSTLDVWAAVNSTLTQISTAGLVRGEEADSVRIATSAVNGYVACHSDNYRRMLDLMGKTVDAEVWAYPEAANDAAIVIATLHKDGSTTTSNASTTATAANQWTKLQLQNISIGNDLVDVEIRLRASTNAKNCHFSRPRIMGVDVYEYMLPKDFDNGDVTDVYIQTSGDIDDLRPRFEERIYGTDIIDDGTYKYLKLPYLYPSPHQLRLLGTKPIPEVDDGADTIPLETHHLRPLICYAAYKLYKFKAERVSSEDRDRYLQIAAQHYGDYASLIGAHSQVQPSPPLNIRM